MRSDYALYVAAIILFIIAVMSPFIVKGELEIDSWVITTVVLGLLFAGLGYTQRPKQKARITVETPPSTPVLTPAPAPAPAVSTASTAPTAPTPAPTVTEPVKEEKIEVTVEPAPSVLGLTEVKGIGEKRKEQLNALGINSVEDLSKAAADDLATKLKVSPKITAKWIEDAKKKLEKS
jgi:predicted flap endonuclease-1-like 5' DNA nuclease